MLRRKRIFIFIVALARLGCVLASFHACLLAAWGKRAARQNRTVVVCGHFLLSVFVYLTSERKPRSQQEYALLINYVVPRLSSRVTGSPLFTRRLGCFTALLFSGSSRRIRNEFRRHPKADSRRYPEPPPFLASANTRKKPKKQQLVRFLRLRCLGGDDAFLLESIFRNEVWDFMNEPVSRTNEEDVNNLLVTRCASWVTF